MGKSQCPKDHFIKRLFKFTQTVTKVLPNSTCVGIFLVVWSNQNHAKQILAFFQHSYLLASVTGYEYMLFATRHFILALASTCLLA